MCYWLILIITSLQSFLMSVVNRHFTVFSFLPLSAWHSSHWIKRLRAGGCDVRVPANNNAATRPVILTQGLFMLVPHQRLAVLAHPVCSLVQEEHVLGWGDKCGDMRVHPKQGAGLWISIDLVWHVDLMNLDLLVRN